MHGCQIKIFFFSETFDENDEEPETFNEKKRKLLGNEVHDGFLNPKKIKIGTITLNPESKMKPKVSPKKKTIETKNNVSQTKHKFSFS